jgi:uncharacterized membrane protein YfcA
MALSHFLFMEDNKKLEKPWWRDGMIIFVKVSSYIAVPIILASFLGKFLDKKYNTANLLFYIFIALAFLSTIYLIWKEMKIYKKKIENDKTK